MTTNANAAQSLARQTAAAVVHPGLVKNSARAHDDREVADAIVEALGVIEALATPTTSLSAHGLRRVPGAFAEGSVEDQVRDVTEYAAQVASQTISTHYANSGGMRVACADRIAAEVVVALFRADLLAVTTTDVVEHLLHATYGTDANRRLADRITNEIATEQSVQSLHTRITNIIWVNHAGGDTAATTATQILDYLGLDSAL